MKVLKHILSVLLVLLLLVPTVPTFAETDAPETGNVRGIQNSIIIASVPLGCFIKDPIWHS